MKLDTQNLYFTLTSWAYDRKCKNCEGLIMAHRPYYFNFDNEMRLCRNCFNKIFGKNGDN